MRVSKCLLFVLIFIQQPFDITQYISNMPNSWSIGNGCNEHFTNWITIDNVETNGHILEIMNAWLDVNGDITENGEVKDVMAMITQGQILLRCTNSTISVNNTLSQQEEELQVVKVYPNPFGDFVYVKGLNIKAIELYDISGKTLLKRPTTLNTTTLQLEHLTPGIYFLKVILHTSEPKVIKIIKK